MGIGEELALKIKGIEVRKGDTISIGLILSLEFFSLFGIFFNFRARSTYSSLRV